MLNRCLDHGVIGNTTGFGSVILGSNPGHPTRKELDIVTVSDVSLERFFCVFNRFFRGSDRKNGGQTPK